jgi:ATP-binding cassette subfamily B protein
MRTWQNSLFAVRLVFRVCPSYPVWTLLTAITSVTAPLTGVLGIKLLIDALTERDLRTTGLVIIFYGLITAITASFQSWYNTVYEPAAKTRITGALSASLLERIAGFDLATSENSEFYNRYSRAVAEANTRAQGVVKTLCGLAGNLLSIGTLTAILISLDWVVMLLTLGGAALMFHLNLKKSKLSFRQYLERTRLERQINYIQRVYYEPQYAREIRLFSMNLFMMKRYKSYFTGLQHMLRQQGLRMWLFSGLEKILNDCLYIVVTLFYLTGRFFAGAITIGGFSALFNGIFQFGDQIYSLLSRLPQLYEHSLYLETVQAVLNTRPSIENTSGIELDPRSPHSIELRHVTFAYPGRPPVFSDLNLKIEAGEQVALLGHNGAGKSTLIRLILRLYDPQEGQVLVDGHDVRTIDIRSLRSCFGVVLQDFQHFAFSIADNITLGRAQCGADKLQNALEQAQLADKIEPLPQGLATPVTREFDDSGIQLSGGEYQKLALARAYVQDSGILLFDEPSSALDPLAEHELFAGLRRYTRQKTVLYVCHKMSLAINADRAILLEQGRIIESGPPEDLLQAGGLYSQLYRLQAEDYQMKSVSMSKPY